MRVRLAMLPLLALALIASSPATAEAHGPVNPVASSYLASIRAVPTGMRATVVDGDLRLWLEVPPGESVFVLDYQGAPYLHFQNGRIWANNRSQMFYLNQTPPLDPPPGLTRTTPAHWVQVASGNSYQWHDGRLHALALQSVAPGRSYIGVWRIPLIVNGRATAVSGTLWYRGAPSIVWFWPIAVIVLSVVALWRLRDLRIDTTVAQALAGMTLLGIVLAAVGRDLHGRPGLSIFGAVELALVAFLTAWTALRTARHRAGSPTYFLIVIAALWEGITLAPTLWHGFVLLAIPAFLGRIATVICLAGAVSLILPAVRLFQEETRSEDAQASADGTASLV